MTAIDKAIDLLDILAADDALGLGRIVAASGLPKPTVRRLLMDLIAQGFVVQNADSTYGLGNAEIDLAARTLAHLTLAEEGRPILQRLREHVAGTITLSRFSDHGLTTVTQIDASSSAFLVSPTSAPLHATAPGKAVLAFMPRPDVDRLVSGSVPDASADASRTATDARERLSDELDVVRDRGYALENEEAQAGVLAVAAPVRTFAHRPIGTVSVASAMRLTSLPELMRMAPHVVHAADQISARLGGPPIIQNARGGRR